MLLHAQHGYFSHIQLLELVLQVITLYYGGHLIIYQEMSPGELVSFLFYQVSLAATIDVSYTIQKHQSHIITGDSIYGLVSYS